MPERYEDNRIYCTTCPEQPEYFNEIMAWQINQVAPDGTVIRMKDGEVWEYRCWNCYSKVSWGHELNP
jgi:hypothetical protein